MPDIEVNGTRYHYRDQGQGAPLILLHGFTGCAASWSEISQPLEYERRTIAIDQPGHGQTIVLNNDRQHSMETIAGDILMIIEALNLEKPDLLGYSMGGRLALYLALLAQDQFHTLILESASPGLAASADQQERVQSDEHWAGILEKEGIESFVDQWEKLPIFASQNLLDFAKINKQRQNRLQNSPQGLAKSLRWQGTGRQPNLWPKLHALKIPTLLLAGALDRKYVAINQEMARLIPKAELLVFSASGHNIHLEHPRRFTKTIQRFLKAGNELAQAKEENK